MIVITKAKGGYMAHATPPHVAEEWLSGRPMNAKELIAALFA
jgi:hypothetical protein